MPFDFSLTELVARIKSGDIRAENVMDEVYLRIDQYNSSLNVYRSILPREIAVSRARLIDQQISAGKCVGKLAGIPVSIKDNICINDVNLNNACGSNLLSEFNSPYNAGLARIASAKNEL